MVNIEWTDEAVNSLKEIHDYIAEDNRQIAERIIQEIYEKTQILTTFPEIGYRYTNIKERKIRVLLYGHYRIAYLIKDKNVIAILGIFHGAMDIERYLKQ